jgi:hypothetical protein
MSNSYKEYASKEYVHSVVVSKENIEQMVVDSLTEAKAYTDEKVESRISSWNDLTDKPFGEDLVEFIEWDGTTEGKYSFEYDNITVLQISDVAISSTDTLIGGSLVLDDTVHELTNEIVLSLGGAIMLGEGILLVPEDNFELAGVLPTSVFFEKKGVYVFNPDQFSPDYVKITFAKPIGEIKKIDEKYLPDTVATKADIIGAMEASY